MKRLRLFVQLILCAVCIFYVKAVEAQVKAKSKSESKSQRQTKLPKKYPDTLIVDSKVAVAYSPSVKRINACKKKWGEEDFYTGADDYIWYMHESQDYLMKKKIKIIYVIGKRYILFTRCAV